MTRTRAPRGGSHAEALGSRVRGGPGPIGDRPTSVTSLRPVQHVIPVVGASAPSSLRSVQDVTLHSIERALDFSRATMTVDVIAARFPDEETPRREWLRDAPVLTSSSRDVGEFRVPRRLPLLRQVLGAFDGGRACDALVLTNADIGLQPAFYEVVAEILDAGYDAFTINRRSVTDSFRLGGGALVRSSTGIPHPGSDCFVMSPDLLEGADVGDVLLGVRWVGQTLLEDLAARARRFRRFTDLHVTFHLGDEREWEREDVSDYERFNHQEYVAAGIRRSRPLASVASPRQPMVIHCATTAGSGAEHLARILGSLPRVNAADERTGELVAEARTAVAEHGLTRSYEHRLRIVHRIESEIDLRPSEHYVHTSHLFLGHWHDVVLDCFDHSRLVVIDLRRDPIDIVESLARRVTSPDLVLDLEWLGIDPIGSESMLGLDARDLADRTDLLIAHVADVAQRRTALRGATPTITWIDADLPDLLTRGGARRLVRGLGLDPPDRWWPLGRGVARTSRSDVRALWTRRSTPRQVIAHRIDDFIARFSDRPWIEPLRLERERWRDGRTARRIG